MLATISAALSSRFIAPCARRNLPALSAFPVAWKTLLAPPRTAVFRVSAVALSPPDASILFPCLSLHDGREGTRATQDELRRRVRNWSVGFSEDWRERQDGPLYPPHASLVRFFSSQPREEENDVTSIRQASEDTRDNEDSDATKTEHGDCLMPSWHDQNFAEMIVELHAFKAKFGSCMVPKVYPPKPALCKWVSHQQRNLRKFKDGKKSPLTEGQVKQLEDLDFVSRKKRTDYDASWLKMFDALRAYKEVHGHCKVSPSSSLHCKLGVWVRQQRNNYKQKRRTMTRERIRMLEELSFDWRLRETNPWWDEYKLLRKHWEQHGNFNIPTNTTEGLHLARWAKGQREQYKRRQQGKHSSLADDRMQALNDIDFVWDLNEARWMDGLEHFRKFRSQYGHSNVTEKSAKAFGRPALHRWVRRQRNVRQLGDTGRGEPMPADRIKLLDDEGFVWDSTEERWNKFFDKLVEFKRTNGHCVLKHSEGPLYTWAKRQRVAYMKYREGKKSHLNMRQIVRLESIGFL